MMSIEEIRDTAEEVAISIVIITGMSSVVALVSVLTVWLIANI